MGARYILLGLGGLFLVAALVRLAAEQWRIGPASRTWLFIGTLFVAVGLWLLYSG
jgi:hypothetical protein